MKKIVTAINNPQIIDRLKEEKNIELIGKNIQYKEGILELLEKNSDIDYIIINNIIPGEITLRQLIETIKIINERINIVLIKEDINNEEYNELKKYGIELIYKREDEIGKKAEKPLENEQNKKQIIEINKTIKSNDKKQIIDIEKHNNNKVNKLVLLTAMRTVEEKEVAIWICKQIKKEYINILLIINNQQINLIKEIRKIIKQKKEKNVINKYKKVMVKFKIIVQEKNRRNNKKLNNKKIINKKFNNKKLNKEKLNNNKTKNNQLNSEKDKREKVKKVKLSENIDTIILEDRQNNDRKIAKTNRELYDLIVVYKDIDEMGIEGTKTGKKVVLVKNNMLGIKELYQKLEKDTRKEKLSKNSLHIAIVNVKLRRHFESSCSKTVKEIQNRNSK